MHFREAVNATDSASAYPPSLLRPNLRERWACEPSSARRKTHG